MYSDLNKPEVSPNLQKYRQFTRVDKKASAFLTADSRPGCPSWDRVCIRITVDAQTREVIDDDRIVKCRSNSHLHRQLPKEWPGPRETETILYWKPKIKGKVVRISENPPEIWNLRTHPDDMWRSTATEGKHHQSGSVKYVKGSEGSNQDKETLELARACAIRKANSLWRELLSDKILPRGQVRDTAIWQDDHVLVFSSSLTVDEFAKDLHDHFRTSFPGGQNEHYQLIPRQEFIAQGAGLAKKYDHRGDVPKKYQSGLKEDFIHNQSSKTRVDEFNKEMKLNASRFPKPNVDCLCCPDGKHVQTVPDAAVPATTSEHPFAQSDTAKDWRGLEAKDCAYCVIEYCCGPNSNMCHDMFGYHEGKPVARVRLTEEHDLRFAEGLEYALGALAKFQGKCPIFLWASLPCTKGCQWQKQNARLNPRRHAINQARHEKTFALLHSNFMCLARYVHKAGGKMCWEWPENNSMWDDFRVKEMLKEFKLKEVRFHGCQVGVRSRNLDGTKGKPHKKPWMLQTDTDEIIDRFKSKQCKHKPWEHEPICGRHTKRSEHYPKQMCKHVHEAVREAFSKAALLDNSDPSGRQELTIDIDKIIGDQRNLLKGICDKLGEGDTTDSGSRPGTESVVEPTPGEKQKIGNDVGVQTCPSDLDEKGPESDSGSRPGTELTSDPVRKKARGNPHAYVDGSAVDMKGIRDDDELFFDFADSPTVTQRWAGAGPIKPNVQLACLFDLDNEWLFDSGCGKDLIALTRAVFYRNLWVSAPSVIFDTANGERKANRILPAGFQLQGEYFKGNPYVMGESPSVLSMGLRCLHQGFAFIWLPGLTPCMITPLGQVIPLDVRGNVPYVKADGLWNTSRDPSELATLCGISLDAGVLKVLPRWDKEVACPGGEGSLEDPTPLTDLAQPESKPKSDPKRRKKNIKLDFI